MAIERNNKRDSNLELPRIIEILGAFDRDIIRLFLSRLKSVVYRARRSHRTAVPTEGFGFFNCSLYRGNCALLYVTNIGKSSVFKDFDVCQPTLFYNENNATCVLAKMKGFYDGKEK